MPEPEKYIKIFSFYAHFSDVHAKKHILEDFTVRCFKKIYPPIPVITPTACCAVTGSRTRASTSPAIETNIVQNTFFTVLLR